MEQPRERPIDFRIFKDLDLPEERHPAGSIILDSGGVGGKMYILKAGRVAVQLNGATIEEIGEGDIFGEMALIDRLPRSAAVVALTPVVTIPIDEKRFLQLIGKVPHFALRVMRTLIRRIRTMNEKLGANAQ